jgi:broad specificity phosphatase PhoE
MNFVGRRPREIRSQITCVALRRYAIDAIFTSSLGRAMATADIIGAHLGLAVTVVDDLAEVDHGRFASLTDEEINDRHSDYRCQRLIDKYRWAFPDGESYADADVRAEHALARIGTHPAHRPLVVSHEMVGSMLQRHLLGLDPRDAPARVHPHDVIYAIDPRTRAIEQLR